jgi:hypothetical protein
MTSSTRILPEGYRQTYEINLAKNQGLTILLNIAGVIVFVISLVLLGSFLRWSRLELLTSTLTFKLDLLSIVGLIASVALTMLVHEFIHGFFFWVFNRSRPIFALRPLYAYAAAPGWFIPTRHYWIIGLAPLVLIDTIGLLFISVAPAGWIPVLVLLVALNIGGAVGDMFIIAQALRLSPGSFAKDVGDTVSFFEPTTAVTKSV